MRVRCIALYIDFLLYIPLYRKLLYKAKKMILNRLFGSCYRAAARPACRQHVLLHQLGVQLPSEAQWLRHRPRQVVHSRRASR